MKILKDSGCNGSLGPHSFRKACATNLYLRHKDLLLVRDYLNHKDAKVLLIKKKVIHRQLICLSLTVIAAPLLQGG